MTHQEHQDSVLRQLEQAVDWRRENLDPVLEKATERYLGKPTGDEQEGRSQIVMTEVRDVTRALMTAMARIFLGPDRVVEFEPFGPEDEELAAQRTDYIQHIVEQDNDGFTILTSAWKDAFVRKTGIIKGWWEETDEVTGSQHTGLDAQQVDVLVANAEDYEVTKNEDGTFNVSLTRRKPGMARIAAVPPEEFIFSPQARSLRDAQLVGHVRDLPASDLIAMGVPEDMVERAKGETERDQDQLVEASRRIDDGANTATEDEVPEEARPVRFADLYVRIDLDGDGITEIRHIQAVGPKAEWVDPEPPIVEAAPFALFEYDHEPHTMVGGSVDDDVGNLQDINTNIVRGMLDSLALSLNPMTEAVEGRVNIKDLLNPEVGRIVRVKQPGMMREVSTPFVGGAALPVLQYMNEIKENRTGQSKAAAGLDPDALQSSTKAAVAATVSAAAQRQEMVARGFAEGGMKQLFKMLLRLVTQHQDRARVVRLRGKFVEVDPRQWDADADVRVNVALGTGLMEERRQVLSALSDKIEQHLANGSPLGSYAKLREVYSRILEMSGFKNSDAFLPPLSEEQEQALKQQQAQNRPPTSDEIYREVEMAKIQAEQQRKMAEMQLKAAELQLERFKVLKETSIKEVDVELKAGQQAVDNALAVAQHQLEQIQAMAATRVGE